MPQRKPRVVVIGAGVSGIITAIEFKKKLDLDVQIYEKHPQPGGTWYANTYPGCACDIKSHWYSLSSEQNPYWSKGYAQQPEIQAYWLRIFQKYNLGAQTSFNTKFLSAEWDDARQLYEIKLELLKDLSEEKFESTDTEPAHKESVFVVEAEIFVVAIGGLSTPLDNPPDLMGFNNYKGIKFHSAKWDHGVDLRNKRVAVIGNGCSAAQFVPKITEDTSTHVLNFSRTPSWFAPRLGEGPWPKWCQELFAYVPGLQRTYRALLVTQSDMSWAAWPLKNKKLRERVTNVFTEHIMTNAPKEYHDFLVPKYPVGCKRIIIDPGYLKALHRPNLDLIWDPIEGFTEDGVKCKSGREHPVDVLILATGFDVWGPSAGINVKGRRGIEVSHQWDQQGGPQAYMGTSLPNFPNMFLLLGPNVATGHTSAIAHIECQVQYAVQLVAPLVKNGVSSFEISAQVEQKYNDWLQARAQGTAWSQCNSWYRKANGKIFAAWPGTFAYFWWTLRRPDFSNFVQRGGNYRIATAVKFERYAKLLAMVVCLVAAQRHGWARLLQAARKACRRPLQAIRG